MTIEQLKKYKGFRVFDSVSGWFNLSSCELWVYTEHKIFSLEKNEISIDIQGENFTAEKLKQIYKALENKALESYE
jgi:hypothetical protein